MRRAVSFRFRLRGDEGSLVPMLLLCFLILVVLVGGFAAASSAFLAQRDLQATCDDAATYSASAVSQDDLAAAGAQTISLPVVEATAKRRVDTFVTRRDKSDPTLSLRVAVDSEVLTVSCQRRAKIAFGALIGRGDGIDRKTESSVRSPLKATAPAVVR